VGTDTAATPGSVAPPPGCAVPARPASAPAPGTELPSHYSQCLGCGVDHATGLHLQMTAGQGLTVTGLVTLTEHHQGAPGLAHGGLLAVALDEVIGGLGWLLQTPMVTGRLQVEYLRPVQIGRTLLLESRVVGVEGRRIFCRATARPAPSDAADPPGEVVARAHGVFVAVPLEHFGTHGRPVAGTERGWQVNP